MIVFLLTAALLIIYLISIKPGKPLEDRNLRFAHRGLHDLSKGIPENSLRAFSDAVKKGFGIEIDLHMTNDGEIVVFHDDDLERICGKKGSIMETGSDEIRELRLSGTDERIPFLSDVLSMVDGKVPILVEIKFEKSAKAICSRVDEIMRTYSGRYYIQSFDPRCLIWYRRNRRDIKRGQLVEFFSRNGTRLNRALEYVLRSMVMNLFSRPNFISYNIKDAEEALSFRIIRKLFRPRIAYWVVRDKKTAAELQEKDHIVLFEEN